MRSNRKHRPWIACVAIVAACSGSEVATATEPGAADTTAPAATAPPETTVLADPLELVMWHTFNETETPTLEGLVATCADETGHNVTLELVPFAEAQNKFKTAAQAGEAPDIMRAEIAWVAEFADLGYLADIGDLVSDDDIADYLPAPLAYDQYAGGLWGVPQVTDAPALYYNTALLAEHGMAVPQTLDELKAAGIALKEATGTPGVGSLMNGYWSQIFIWSFGGELLSEDGSQVLVDAPEAVAGLEFYLSMAADGAMNADLDFANQYGNVQEAFKSGDIAFNINGPWQSGDLLSGDAFADSPDNLGIAPIPAGPAGQASPVGGHSWVISADAADAGTREASYEFLGCVNSTESQVIWALENNLLPTRASAYADPRVQENRVVSAFGAQMEVATSRPVIPEGGALYAAFDPNVQAAFSGEKTAQEALADIAVAWRELVGVDG